MMIMMIIMIMRILVLIMIIVIKIKSQVLDSIRICYCKKISKLNGVTCSGKRAVDLKLKLFASHLQYIWIIDV